MTSQKPLILVTNDDGIHAAGLRALIDVVRELGDVVVVAPDKPQSGMSHAVTTSSPLRIRKIHEEPGYSEYSCNGTPADSVKLGENIVIKGKADLVVSGINHGSNSGINLFYSGTMAAAIEAAMGGVNAIGFSLLDYSLQADFESGKPYIRKIISRVLSEGLPLNTCLNVNIPSLPFQELKGIKVCRMGKGFWDEEMEERTDPHNHPYYWLAGNFVSRDIQTDTDEWALANHYVSVVPIQLDLTAYSLLEPLKHLENHD
ncbi:MAG: 5'/3'-nucleotidase SurE [Bacteroidetes bacterium]|nr:5'/3'-nucleotidase SurE [Bacteroidota bacterium]